MNSRAVALQVLEEFHRRGDSLDRCLEHGIREAHVDHRDRRFVTELVKGTIRRQATLDHLIDHFVTTRRLSSGAPLRRILRLGAYQVLYLDRVPHHAAVNEAVKAAKADKRTASRAGMVNAVLRRVINCRTRLPLPSSENLPARLAVEHSHPEWLVRRWLQRYGLAKAKALMMFNNRNPTLFLRRKIRGLSRQQFEIAAGRLCAKPTGLNNLFYPLQLPFERDQIAIFRDGHCTVQAPSSGWVVRLLDIEPNSLVLDLCCGPGGKTGLISELLGPSGRICACDISYRRVDMTLETVERMGLLHVLAAVADGRRPALCTQFDRVLVDAPCTATGVFHRHPEARWRRLPADLHSLPRLQKQLLHGGSTLVAEGGLLVYATCSLEPEENEEVVASFLEAHEDFRRENPPVQIPGTLVDLDGFLRITPHGHGMDGMFGARLRRIGEAER